MATYYVAKTGKDFNAGTIGSPWLTVQKAATTMVAGDTVYIRTGTYTGERVTPTNSGSAGAGYITYSAYPGETVTLDINNALPWQWTGGFEVYQKNYIIISGLRIINSNGFGLFVSTSTNIKLLNNYVYNTRYSGIWVGDSSNTITIDGNETEHTNIEVNQEAISIASSTNVIVSNNRVHDALKEGIDAKGSTNVQIFNNEVWDMNGMGIYVDSYLNTPLNIQVYNNVVHDSKNPATWPLTGLPYNSSRDGIILAAENGNYIDGVSIYNNVIYNIAQTGIILSYFHYNGQPEPQHKNISIYNNTIHNANIANSGAGGILVQGASNTNIAIKNNIISSGGSFNMIVSTGTTISNNLFHGGSTLGSNPVTGNPLFVSTASGNLNIQAGSPAIDAGLSSGAPAFDYSYVARPQGPSNDIGAYEYIPGGTSTGTFTNGTSLNVVGIPGKYTPYPSPITVSSMGGTITKVTVTINNYAANSYGSINAILQAPNGTLFTALVSADVGAGAYTKSWVMDQSSATLFPAGINTVTNGSSYKPYNRYAMTALPSPAPNPGGGVPYSADLTIFNGISPNGTWNLWGWDGWDPSASSPVMSGGWSLTITTDALTSTGTLNSTLSNTTLSSSGNTTIKGTIAQNLSNTTINAVGYNGFADLNAILDNTTLVSSCSTSVICSLSSYLDNTLLDAEGFASYNRDVVISQIRSQPILHSADDFVSNPNKNKKKKKKKWYVKWQ